MNLATTVSIYGGGPGSGCTGPDCGRKPQIGPVSNPGVIHRGTEGWILPDGSYAEKREGPGFQTHVALAKELGLIGELGQGEQVAKNQGAIRVSSWGDKNRRARVEMDLIDSPEVRERAARVIENSPELTSVDLEMVNPGMVRRSDDWQENITPAQAVRYLRHGVGLSDVAKWHQMSASKKLRK